MKKKGSPTAGQGTPTPVNGTVVPKRVRNEERRSREHLTPGEIGLLMKTARRREGRHGHRDATMILICYRHVLRVGELCSLRWDQFDFEQGLVHVRRLKNGRPSVHPLRGTEIRELRRLKREQLPASPYVFTTERKGPMTTAGFRKLLARVGEAAGMPFSIHPHMLRHSGGYKLANDGVDTRALQHWFGHKNIQNTVRYTELAADRFKSFWESED
jgi:integrase